MKQSELKALIKECYREVLAENDSAITKPLDDKIQEDPDFLKKLQAAASAAEKGNTTDLALMMSENEKQTNIEKIVSEIEMLKNKLAPFIADFKSKKLSKEQYMEATKGLRTAISETLKKTQSK
jgi:hypothetical protein